MTRPGFDREAHLAWMLQRKVGLANGIAPVVILAPKIEDLQEVRTETRW